MAEQNSSPEGRQPFRVGWLADLESLAHNPQRLAELQDSAGINTVWLESGRYHTAGFSLSQEAWQSSPFKDWRDRPGLARHRQARHLAEPAFPVLPGILAGADDTGLLKVLEIAEKLGIEVWGHMGLWSYGAMIYPELAVQSLSGEAVPAAEDAWGACFCPSKPALNDWLMACLRDSVGRYPVSGIEVDHARYIPPASLPNLLTCACPDCVHQAAAWGVDLPGLVGDLQAAIDRTRKFPEAAIRRILEEAETLLGALELLTPGGTAHKWLELRARHISSALEQMAHQAHAAAGRPFEFGSDVFPPSIALLGGHHYENLSCLDYFTGGFGTIGWERVALNTCKIWTSALCTHWPGLSESFVLAQLYRVFGLEGLDLPARIRDLDRPAPHVLASVQAREIINMAGQRPPGVRVYPPLSLAALGDEGTQVVCNAIRNQRLDGVMIAGLENTTAEQDRRIAANLARSL